ncbi:hypothetical protein QYF36_003970 [Acer negundo]|nr:hypothetical protein QYF36_003970 [Acer negundo]
MTLEDFFSLTEMKDGLTAPSRVEELVSVMQKEKDCVVKNVGDAARQWAAVASTIAATENRDCLDRFIQLDGLGFIDRWLKNAQKFANDANENFLEESITAMLRALEKLHIDNERSVSSGIWITVESLLGHSSSQIQDRARALFDSWKKDRVNETVDHDVESARPCHNDGVAVSSMHAGESSRSTCSALDVPLPKASTNEENNRAEPAETENLPSSSEDLQPQRAEAVQIESCNNELPSEMNLDHADIGDKLSDRPPSSVVSNSVVENSFTKEKSPISTVEGISSIETCSSPVMKQSRNEGQCDTPKINEFSKDDKQVHKVSSFPDKLCVTAAASASGTVEPRTVPSSADVPNANESISETALENKLDTNESDMHKKAIDLGDTRASASEPNSGIDDMAVGVNCSTQAFKTNVEDDECHSDAKQDSSGDEYLYRKHKDLDTSLSRIKDTGAVDEDMDHTSDEDKDQTSDEDKDRSSDESSDSRNDYSFSIPAVDTRTANVNRNGMTDIGLEFGIVDALEVARKVAQEVEREVVDYREPDSPDSINGNQDLLDEVKINEVTNGENSAEADPEGEGHLINSDNLETGQENGIADMESSQVTEAAQEPEVNPERGFCDFDLNQEVCSDDMDRPVNPISTTVSVVSASRAAAASGLPAAPLQFEGALGWKGSAATSAFRPASPRRVSDSDKTALTVGGTRQRQDFLDFDLNVAECADDKHADLMPEKQIPVSSSFHSAESSLEVSPRRSERLKLDLNRISDDSDAPPSDLRMEGRLHYNRNGHRSPSPASSSSSMQPSLRNIDLNDRPYLQNDFLEQGPYLSKSSQNVSAFIAPKPDDPVISIMGARVEVNKKDFISQISSMPNGKSLETAIDANNARAGGLLGLGSGSGSTVSYTHSPMFGYNGLTTAPGFPYSSAMYGPGGSIPYMVDSRGSPVVPQILGSATAVPPSYSQSPFMMSMTSTPSGLNVAGPSRPNNFDLNSGFPIEGGNRDTLGLRQLFMPGQVRSMEEHIRANSQPSSSSGVGGKRKEPDSGWEPYPFMNRHQQPPWK